MDAAAAGSGFRYGTPAASAANKNALEAAALAKAESLDANSRKPESVLSKRVQDAVNRLDPIDTEGQRGQALNTLYESLVSPTVLSSLPPLRSVETLMSCLGNSPLICLIITHAEQTGEIGRLDYPDEPCTQGVLGFSRLGDIDSLGSFFYMGDDVYDQVKTDVLDYTNFITNILTKPETNPHSYVCRGEEFFIKRLTINPNDKPHLHIGITLYDFRDGKLYTQGSILEAYTDQLQHEGMTDISLLNDLHKRYNRSKEAGGRPLFCVFVGCSSITDKRPPGSIAYMGSKYHGAQGAAASASAENDSGEEVAAAATAATYKDAAVYMENLDPKNQKRLKDVFSQKELLGIKKSVDTEVGSIVDLIYWRAMKTLQAANDGTKALFLSKLSAIAKALYFDVSVQSVMAIVGAVFNIPYNFVVDLEEFSKEQGSKRKKMAPTESNNSGNNTGAVGKASGAAYAAASSPEKHFMNRQDQLKEAIKFGTKGALTLAQLLEIATALYHEDYLRAKAEPAYTPYSVTSRRVLTYLYNKIAEEKAAATAPSSSAVAAAAAAVASPVAEKATTATTAATRIPVVSVLSASKLASSSSSSAAAPPDPKPFVLLPGTSHEVTETKALLAAAPAAAGVTVVPSAGTKRKRTGGAHKTRKRKNISRKSKPKRQTRSKH